MDTEIWSIVGTPSYGLALNFFAGLYEALSGLLVPCSAISFISHSTKILYWILDVLVQMI